MSGFEKFLSVHSVSAFGCYGSLFGGRFVGMLRAMFNDVGRRIHVNPFNSDNVKGWVRSCAKEQQRRRVRVKQAQPTPTHLSMLVKEIMFRLALSPLPTPSSPNILLR